VSLTWTDSITDLDGQELSALYQAAPLGQKNAADLQLAFSNSRIVCLVRDQGVLVGAGRALADGVDCAYICDVALLPSHQGTGLGKQLMQRLVQRCAGHKKIILYAVRGKEPFYKQLGFKRMTTAMAIFADPARALAAGQVDES
jgi:GNAT superfamily N-acetyltransferase